MNPMIWGGSYLSHEELTIGSMQIKEYFDTGKVSTNFTKLSGTLLRAREVEARIRANKIFYIQGTSRVH